MPDRAYLDWNATAPLRPEARAAMIEAMDVVGNPSSVHTEGRAAKMIVEKAREQVAALVGCDTSEVVFTSGATEAAAIVGAQHYPSKIVSMVEHDAAWSLASERSALLPVERNGCVDISLLAKLADQSESRSLIVVQAANSETGVKQDLTEICRVARQHNHDVFVDATQVFGKADRGVQFEFDWAQDRPTYSCLSAHKFGGPSGVGALIVRGGTDVLSPHQGGGQESGRRAGTEAVASIAGFGAACAALPEIFSPIVPGELDGIYDMMDHQKELEDAVSVAAPDAVFMGRLASRLPNTSCFAIPGWKGETQVMQLDLAGFAVSAGSACSSGKVGPSRVLKAMGFDDITASSAIRVSMGPTTTKDEVSRFIDAWTGLYRKMKTRAA